MNIGPAIFSVVGWHAGKSVAQILAHKCNDIQKIGRTIWFFQSWKARIPTVQQFAQAHADPRVIFLEGSAYPASTAAAAIEMSVDQASWQPLPPGIGAVTGKLPGGGLVIGELELTGTTIDLWNYLDHTDSKPLRFQQGASTACCIPSTAGPVAGMKSRYRRVVAVGRLASPYGVFLR